MIIVMKPGASKKNIENVLGIIRTNGLEPHLSDGKEVTIIGVVGDKTRLMNQNLEIADGVERIVSVTKSYKLANKKFHPEQTVVRVGNASIGGDEFTIMSGPCAVESAEQVLQTAKAIKKSGAQILRGATGLSVVCEVTSLTAIETAVKYVDMLQIGARNMQNFYLLKEAGKTGLPVLLKRGLSATIDEWLNAAEYIMSEGNPNVVLCERGIRTFETATRNTLDISAVPVIRAKSHLPIIVDPSHATGVRDYVAPLAKCAVSAGADGLMIETHPCPEKALSDGPQSLTFPQFDALCNELRPFIALSGKKF